MRTEFSRLDASDFDVILVKECGQLSFRSIDAIDIDLENTRRSCRRTRRTIWRRRTRIRRDAGDEEEEEDESTRKV